MAPRFTEQQLRLFFEREVSELDEYLDVVNLAHRAADDAFAALLEVLDAASSEADIAQVGACLLEPVLDLHGRALAERIAERLSSDARFRRAYAAVANR